MAELSVEEAARLARNFLIGKGSDAELEDLRRSIGGDSELALEFLQQMQSALDDVAPAGFTPEQSREVDARVEALAAPLIRSRLGFLGRLFSALFKKKAPAAAGEAHIKRRGPSPGAAPAPAPEPASASPAGGMEEMAPIVAPSASAEDETAPISAAPAAEPAQAAASPRSRMSRSYDEAPPRRKFPWAGLAKGMAALGLAAGLAYGGYLWNAGRKAAPAPLPPPVPRVVPTPSPAPQGPPVRSQPYHLTYVPLPSELPPQTPQAQGRPEVIHGLEASDAEGRRLPLR